MCAEPQPEERKLYTGEPLVYTTFARGSITVENSYVSLFRGVQPGIIAKLVWGYDDQGYYSRLLIENH